MGSAPLTRNTRPISFLVPSLRAGFTCFPWKADISRSDSFGARNSNRSRSKLLRVGQDGDRFTEVWRATRNAGIKFVASTGRSTDRAADFHIPLCRPPLIFQHSVLKIPRDLFAFAFIAEVCYRYAPLSSRSIPALLRRTI